MSIEKDNVYNLVSILFDLYFMINKMIKFLKFIIYLELYRKILSM